MSLRQQIDRGLMLRRLQANRYVTPLREGGSLPAVVEANDDALYVMKFRGAGEGQRALIAELLAGEIGRALGLRVPELVLLEMNSTLGRSEPDQEIQDLLQASVGLNLGMRYLPGALAYNPIAKPNPDAMLASTIVWFDAYVTNVDRTANNVNMLIWEDELWAIDHGAALYFHHDWGDYLARSRTPFAYTSQHVLLYLASELSTVGGPLRASLSDDVLAEIVAVIPDEWLGDEAQFADAARHRQAYLDYLRSRRDAADIFVKEAIDARAKR